HPTHWHRAPHVAKPRLSLRMDADVITAVAGGELLPGRHQVETGPRGQLGPELFGPELLDQVTHARQTAAFSVAELAEKLGDGPGHLDGLLGAHEHVDV